MLNRHDSTATSSSSGRRDSIVVTLKGGLGNQMFQYAFGLALADERDGVLLVDSSPLDADSKRSFELDPCRPAPRSIRPPVRWLLQVLRRTPLWHRLGRSRAPVYRGGPRVVIESSSTYDPTVRTLEGSLILDGYWQSEEYFADHRGHLEQVFDWSALIQDAGDVRLADGIRGSESVAVHVRRGDYVSEPHTHAFHGTCEPDYYAEAAELVRREVGPSRFFVFSDDPDWAEEHLRLPGEIVVVRHRSPPPPHVDMWLMSRCRHAIIANSSYSWWAAWLADRPGKIIVAPRCWFRDPAMKDRSPAPARWQRV